MNELSLFTGAGGGLLGTMLLGWRPIGYVEWDDYCQRIIAARIRDGYLPNAPIFGDIHAFIRDGYANSYQGLADVVSAGFPCQPFSVAGKMAADDDPRNGWPATIDVVRIVRPEWVWLENVPGLVTGSHGYFRTILSDLSASGYSARWRRLSAAELGAPHLRDRIWIVAHADGCQPGRGQQSEWGSYRRDADIAGDGAQGLVEQQNSNAKSQPSRRLPGRACSPQSKLGSICSDVSNAEYNALENDEQHHNSNANTDREVWWLIEPDVGRVADGVAARVDRLRAIGNGQVPAVAARAWVALLEAIP
jgi:DNA (cytosine-5)-methyltransferase 1